MSTLTVTAEGHVALPQEILQHLGVQPGEKLALRKLPDGRIELIAVRPAGQISDAFDIFKRTDGPSLSVEEMNGIAANGWAGRRGS
jgi:AbrB family looped-hinge helix DNA binding protein